jgi:hypothetical protein
MKCRFWGESLLIFEQMIENGYAHVDKRLAFSFY